jgi:hypothetical protein
MSTSRFIKLGNSLLNTNSIRRVWIDPKEFQIELNPGGTSGFLIMGSGQFAGDNDVIKVNKEKHSQAYNELENWIRETITTIS